MSNTDLPSSTHETTADLYDMNGTETENDLVDEGTVDEETVDGADDLADEDDDLEDDDDLLIEEDDDGLVDDEDE